MNETLSVLEVAQLCRVSVAAVVRWILRGDTVRMRR
jgi:hypothetical protein